jgi:Cu(I)/Ag(I) efflux system periplasmic protein CusF
MKFTPTLTLIFALSASGLAISQSGGMKDMDMQGMSNKPPASSEAATHKAIGMVKGVDTANGKVKLAHEPVKSLNWPAMTMNFSVKDPALFDKLVVGKKVEVEFVQQGTTSVITAVK